MHLHTRGPRGSEALMDWGPTTDATVDPGPLTVSEAQRTEKIRGLNQPLRGLLGVCTTLGRLWFSVALIEREAVCSEGSEKSRL